MTKKYSIAEARDNLPGVIHEVEGGTRVEPTRRGKPATVHRNVVWANGMEGGIVRRLQEP